MESEQADRELLAIVEALSDGFYQDLRRESLAYRGRKFISKLIGRVTFFNSSNQEMPDNVVDLEDWRHNRGRG